MSDTRGAIGSSGTTAGSTTVTRPPRDGLSTRDTASAMRSC